MKYIEFLEKFSSVSSTFIRDFFTNYDETTKPGDFVISLDVTAKYLQAQKQHLMVTLRESYVENVDYKIMGKVESESKRRGPKTTQVLMTADCFKLLCMQSRSKKSSEVRLYFLELERTLMRYKDTINEALMQRVQDLESNQKPIADAVKRGVIYIILVSAAMSLYKIGQTMGMRHRASTYMADKADNSDLKIVHMYETENVKEVEGCLKALLKSKQYRKRKEVYQIDIDILKKLIHEHCGPGATEAARPSMSLVRANNSALAAKSGGGGTLYAVIM
jgi:phage anti-repressor protein